MNTFEYILRFDDEEHSLNAHDGIPLDELAELLRSLHKTLHLAQDEKIVLSEVINGSYAPKFSMNSYQVQAHVANLHERISHSDFVGMNRDERQYAEVLKGILKDRYFVQGFDPKYPEKRVQIDTIVIPKKPNHFYEIATIYGIVTAIGGRLLNGKTSIHVSNTIYYIEVTPEQEGQLVQSFKKDRLALTVRQKVSYETGEVTHASLEEFEVMSTKTFAQAAKELRQKYPDGLFITPTNGD